MGLIARWECQTCGRGAATAFGSHKRRDDMTKNCHGPVVRVEYAPAEQLRGAVEALERIRDKARLAEKDPGGAMAASWVEGVADDALTDLGGR